MPVTGDSATTALMFTKKPRVAESAGTTRLINESGPRTFMRNSSSSTTLSVSVNDPKTTTPGSVDDAVESAERVVRSAYERFPARGSRKSSPTVDAPSTARASRRSCPPGEHETRAAIGEPASDRSAKAAACTDDRDDRAVKVGGHGTLLLLSARERPMRTSTPGDHRAIGSPRGGCRPAAPTSVSSHASTSASWIGHGGWLTLTHTRRRPNVVPSAHRAVRK